MGSATMKFNEGIIVSGSAVNNEALIVTGSAVILGNLSDYVMVVDNDENSSGHVMKLATDGNGSGSRLLEMEDGDGDVIFRARADGRFGFGPDGVNSMGAGTFVVGIDNSSHTSDIAISQRLQHLGDSNTYMDFPSNDNITFAAGGSEELKIASDAILVKQSIKHDGDEDTLINFLDDKIVLKAGGKAMITLEENASSPHEITLNDGSNNIDFVVKGNGSGQGNPGMKFDASSNRLGVNGVGTPDKALHVGGSMKLDGTESTIFFADDAAEKAEIGINNSDNIVIENKTINKHIVFKCNDQGVVREGLRLDGAVPEVVVNQQSESLINFRVESDNNTHMLFVTGSGQVGIGTSSPISALDVAGKIAITAEVSTPAQPADGKGYLYTKSDGKIYWRSHDVSEVDLTAVGGGGGGGSGDNLSVTQPKTGNYTAANWEFVLVNLAGASGDVTVTLPAASADKQVAIKINSLAMGREVIVDGNGSETIDGLTTRIMNTDYESMHLISDGNAWWRIS